MIDPNVYKTPSFTELGMKKDIQVKAQREERQREAGFDIAEKSWNEAQYLLTGARKNVAQEAWKLYSEAEIAYEKTGSDSDKRKAKELQAQLMFFVGAGSTMQKTWNQEYANAQSAEFAGYADSPEQILRPKPWRPLAPRPLHRLLLPTELLLVLQRNHLLPLQVTQTT